MKAATWRELPRFAYGDTPEMADAILALVLDGTMTASCMDVRSAGVVAPMPEKGARAVVLDSRDRPRAVIETTAVRTGPISSVEIDFVVAEGEGIDSIPAWLARHALFFARNRGYTPDMPVIFERFRLVGEIPETHEG